MGGRASVPVVIWSIINRGGEQAAQHSQALHAVFAHVPGIKVVMPSNPFDAKGLFISAIKDSNPVLFIDDRWLYDISAYVPKRSYSVPIGKGVIRRKGKDVSIVASSYMVLEALAAAKYLAQEGVDAEVIDLRTLKPLDEDILFTSVKKSGKLVAVDAGWKTCGVAAEISALVCEKMFRYLKAPVVRVTLPDAPAPANSILEKRYYPNANDIYKVALNLVRGKDGAKAKRVLGNVITNSNYESLFAIAGK